MGTATYSEDFKRDAIAQITERSYLVSDVSERLEGERSHVTRSKA